MTSKLEDRAFLACLIAVSVAFALILKPFFTSIFWGALLALLFYPLQHRLLKRMPDRRNLVSLMTLVLSLLVVVIPLLLIVAGLAQEGTKFYLRIQQGDIDLQKFVDQLRDALPAVESLLHRFDIDLANVKKQLSEGALVASKFLATQAFSIGQNTFEFSLIMVMMLYLMFFFLRDGEQLINLMIRALPLGDERERHLFDKFAEVARATVKGNLVVAVAQGTLGGLLFWGLGIQGALLWGVVMTVLSLLPAIGSALVWGPVGIYLLVTGQMVSGVIMLLFGAFVIGLVDNVLRPILVGRDTKLPDYIVLLSTLGGIALFGLNGFVMGPALAALFLAFWQIFIREFNHQDAPLSED